MEITKRKPGPLGGKKEKTAPAAQREYAPVCTYCKKELKQHPKSPSIYYGFYDQDEKEVVCFNCQQKHYNAKEIKTYSEVPLMYKPHSPELVFDGDFDLEHDREYDLPEAPPYLWNEFHVGINPTEITIFKDKNFFAQVEFAYHEGNKLWYTGSHHYYYGSLTGCGGGGGKPSCNIPGYKHKQEGIIAELKSLLKSFDKPHPNKTPVTKVRAAIEQEIVAETTALKIAKAKELQLPTVPAVQQISTTAVNDVIFCFEWKDDPDDWYTCLDPEEKTIYRKTDNTEFFTVHYAYFKGTKDIREGWYPGYTWKFKKKEEVRYPHAYDTAEVESTHHAAIIHACGLLLVNLPAAQRKTFEQLITEYKKGYERVWDMKPDLGAPWDKKPVSETVTDAKGRKTSKPNVDRFIPEMPLTLPYTGTSVGAKQMILNFKDADLVKFILQLEYAVEHSKGFDHMLTIWQTNLSTAKAERDKRAGKPVVTLPTASEAFLKFIPVAADLRAETGDVHGEDWWRSRWNEWIIPPSNPEKHPFEYRHHMQNLWPQIWEDYHSALNKKRKQALPDVTVIPIANDELIVISRKPEVQPEPATAPGQIKPGIYECLYSYSRFDGPYFKKGTKIMVHEVWEEEAICLCQFVDQSIGLTNFHITVEHMHEHWEFISALPVNISSPAQPSMPLPTLYNSLTWEDISLPAHFANDEEPLNPLTGTEILMPVVVVQQQSTTLAKPDAESYPGNKHSAGVYQRLINQLPVHDVFVSGFLGKCAVMSHKLPAMVNYGIDPNLEGLKTYWDSLQRSDLQLFRDSFFEWIKKFTFSKATKERWLIYLDPTYLLNTRSSGKIYYDHEMTDGQHADLIKWAIETTQMSNVMIAISHYPCKEYDGLLKHGFRKMTYRVATHNGPVDECLYMNYPEPDELHDYQFFGDDKIKRQAYKRKETGYIEKFQGMPVKERKGILRKLAAQFNVSTPPPPIFHKRK